LFGLRLAVLNPWRWLADVVFLWFVFVQVALLGHDVAHMQFLRAGRANTTLALILGNLLVGVSRAWWKDNHDAHHAHPNELAHDAHHAHPNDLAHDPNVNIVFLAYSAKQALKRPPWVRWIVRHLLQRLDTSCLRADSDKCAAGAQEILCKRCSIRCPPFR
jgi:fatty acid desaturase